MEWLKHFDKETNKCGRHPTAKRLLIMDGHGSHLTVDFIEYYDLHSIIPFLLPPHATHLLQPLDIGVFQSYKHYHQELLEENVHFGGIDFNRLEFLRILQKMRKLTFKSRVIQSAWAKAGLFPYNPSIVLAKMKEFNPPQEPTRLITPENQAEFNFANCCTPTLQMSEITKYSQYIDMWIKLSI
jgi:hypothetical protein